MSHIFISYSKKNRDYARPLADHLISLGFDVWIDDEIQPSEDWWRNIRQAIKDCAAFVLVMTPEAETSRWVGLELLHALEYEKAMFPLLRAGDPNLLSSDSWSRIANLQYTDVRSGAMPSEIFIQNLVRRGVPRKSATGGIITPSQHTRIEDILSPPFGWCSIPKGKVTLTEGGYVPKGGATFDVPAFDIAKYPITNAQFAKFIHAKGYEQKKWWTEDGWTVCQEKQWIESRYWQDKKWNQADYPVVGISWYESVAFCLWLSDVTGETIMLPTEQQWQHSARGDDNRTYPWGMGWDCRRCNNSVKPCESNSTTPVTRYEGQNMGDSPFGVVDMAGNVWEWGLTQYQTGETDLGGTDVRVLRGGSWFNGDSVNFRADVRIENHPNFRNSDWGFRLARS